LLNAGSWQGELHQRHRDGRKLVVLSNWALHYNGNGQPRFRQIDTLQIRVACVADVHADVRDLGRGIICHLRFPFFSTRRTINSSESPLVSAEHANQRLFRTVAFAPQYAEGRLAAAKRAGRWSSIHNLDFAVIRKIFSIWLQKNPREQPIERIRILRTAGPGGLNVVADKGQSKISVPEVFNSALPSRWTFLRQASSGLCKRRWRNLLDQRQESGKFWQEQEKI